MPSIPHPLDMPKKRLKQTIHSLCSTLNVSQQQKNSLGLPLSSMNKQRSLKTSKYRTLFHNSKRTRSVYPSALPLQPQVGFIPHNLSIRNSTRRNPQTYLQNFNWLPPTKVNLGKKRREREKKTVQQTRLNGGKVLNVLSGCFRTGSPRPIRTFAPGQCIPATAIMQFRRNVYEYSTKKLRPSLPHAK